MPVTRAANVEPIPGYRLVEPLGKGGFGEVWRCTAPGGLFKALKIVQGNQEIDNAGSNAEQELRAFELIRSIRHPFLLSIERVEVVQGDLVIVMELADKSLHDLLTDYKQRGQAGVPRREAVAYLHEAAEVLDLLNQEHGLQHLDIKPRNLFLVGKHLKVADFGLVGSLADLFAGNGGGRVFAGGLTPLYAAPETFKGQVTLFSDQYSLAVTYHELVTGEPVFQARNYNQLAMMACGQEPDLSRLAEEERPALARALSKDPRARYPSCVELVNALEDALFAPVAVHAETPSRSVEHTDVGITPGPRGSGHYRRRSRILPAVKAPAPDADPLAGYQLLESLGRGPAGELWKAKGPGGGGYLVRFLSQPETDPGLERLRGLRHPVLAGTRVFAAGPGRTAFVSEAGGSTLWDRFREAHAAGQPGVPREELLGHLGRIADALDELYHHHQTQHLALSPRHVALSGEEAFLLEFGLAEWLWMPQGLSAAHLNPRYAAPELFDGLVSDACDQYALALMFHELLVGVHPFRNLNARQLASPKLRGQPDVSLLPGPDRAVVLQALSPDPERRFRSCAEFIQALEEGALGGAVSPSAHVVSLPHPGDDWRPALADLAAAAGRGHVIRSDGALPYRLLPGGHLECRAFARLAPGMAKLKLAGFRDQWRAEKADAGEGRVVFHIEGAATLWDRCMGRSPALQVEICFGPPDNESGLSPIRIHMMPVECPRSRGETLLAELAPRILSSLVTYLGLIGHKNGQERFPLTQFVRVATGAREWQGQLRDIGGEGMCVRLPEAVPACPVTVTLQRWASPLTFNVPGRVLAVFPAEGGYEAEIVLS